MIKIEAVIRPQKLEQVRQALLWIGVRGMTVTAVHGLGQEKSLTQHYRGAAYPASLLPKIKIEVLVVDREARVVANAIAEAACTGNVGDGKIFFIPVTEAIRIRTGEEGESAIS